MNVKFFLRKTLVGLKLPDYFIRYFSNVIDVFCALNLSLKRSIKSIIAIFTLLVLSSVLNAQKVIELYTGVIPNTKGDMPDGIQFEGNPGVITKVYRPELEVFMPAEEKANGTAVIICPGGAYGAIVYQGEGVTTAKKFAENGVVAFVLKYRLPDKTVLENQTIAPLQDALQAMKLVRENASKWNIDSQKIGVVGFSAGGHLASTLATHYNDTLVENPNQTSLRPDFQILVYPVISMQDELTHPDSRTNLLGENPSQVSIDYFSNELQVDTNTPPAFITHAADDRLVDVDNSIEYFEQLRKNKVAVEMYICQKGNHGFIFKHKNWMQPLLRWMNDSALLGEE